MKTRTRSRVVLLSRLPLAVVPAIFVCCIFLSAEPAVAAAAPPNIILITIDTVRADRMGFLGASCGLTPNLDLLSRDSVSFSRAYSQVPLTNPSHATILTGTYPQFHRVNDFGIPLANDLPDVADILKSRGYRTAAFVGSSILDPKGTAPGFDRGFDLYNAETGERRSADQVIELAQAWLKTLQERSSMPFFLWIHFYDAHAPYLPPEPFLSRYPGDPYDATIAYVDLALGNFFKQLRTTGLYDGSVIALMSDHGEALGDHGEREHGFFLYDETIHVPLLLKLPKNQFSGDLINSGVGLVDVAPTILQIAGIPIPAAMQGESLLPLLKSPSAQETTLAAGLATDRQVYSETDYPYLAFGWSSLRALRSNKYLFIDAPRKELYERATDLTSTHNQAATSVAITGTMQSLVESFRDRTSNSSPLPKAILDAQQIKKLSALGYLALGRANTANHSMDATRADPKDKIEVSNLVTEALRDMSKGRDDEAVSLLQNALVQEPDSATIHQMFGESSLRLHKYQDATASLRKSLQLGSDTVAVHLQLGLALFALEEWKDAAVEFAATIAKSPLSPEAHYWLGSTYSRMKRYSEAEKELTATIEFQPNNFAALMEIGQIFLIERSPQRALMAFKKAADLEPQIGDPHHFLARAYAAMGDDENARRENAEAVRLTQAQGATEKR